MGERGFSTRSVTLVVVGALLPFIAWTAVADGRPAQAAETAPPNVVLVLVDDMGTDLLDAMPRTQNLLLDQGAWFTNGVAPTSLCCPARAALLSGTYSHTNGVWSNFPPDGGWSAFAASEDQTLATALDDAGYHTGHFGKYLNGWSTQQDPAVPAGWDVFRAMRGIKGGAASYYDYSLVGTGEPELFGSAETDYSTDVLATRTAEFITGTPAEQPVFAVFAPYAPHAPFTSAPRHLGLWPRESVVPPANEKDMSDKPLFMQSLPLLPAKEIRRVARKQHESLLAVDEAVQLIYDALGPERQANTLFLFLSDNGLMNGDHRFRGKYMPHESATEIPVLMRWDGVIPAGAVEERVLTIQDITTTVVEAAGASLPTEGVSYLTGSRDGTLVEGIEQVKDGIARPAYCGWRTPQYLYVRYSNGAGEELYDYDVDPAELQNKVTDAAYAETATQLRAQAQAACDPGPPGFLWDPLPAEQTP